MKLLEAAFQIQEDTEAPVNLEMPTSEIYEAKYKATVNPDIKINENEKTQYKN